MLCRSITIAIRTPVSIHASCMMHWGRSFTRKVVYVISTCFYPVVQSLRAVVLLDWRRRLGQSTKVLEVFSDFGEDLNV